MLATKAECRLNEPIVPGIRLSQQHHIHERMTEMQSRLAYAALAIVAAGTLAACGGDDSGSSGTSGSEDGAAPGGAETGTSVAVDETDFDLALSVDTFSPGVYTFEISNDGDTTHALEVEGPGVEDVESDQIGPGESTSLTVTLEQGEYTIYCPVDGHADLGMSTTITVG